MTLVYAPRFIEQAASVQSWWVANRPAAPTLFEDELREALASIRDNPRVGLVYLTTERGDTRRLMLRRTRYHVYYRIEEPSILVLNVWSARRGAGPVLG